MKNLILTSIIIMSAFALSAQNFEGTVQYVETTKMEIPEEAKQYAHLFPSERKSSAELIFSAEQSLFKLTDSGARNTRTDDGQGNETEMRIVVANPKHDVYRDFKTGELIQGRQLFGKDFLVKGQSDFIQWKIENEQKEQNGYTCSKATTTIDDEEIVAWFTSDIPVYTGPRIYGNLPGLILEVNIDGGRSVIIADQIQLKDVDDNLFVIPTKGKKMSREKYNKLAEEKMKEMEEEMGGSRIRIEIEED